MCADLHRWRGKIGNKLHAFFRVSLAAAPSSTNHLETSRGSDGDGGEAKIEIPLLLLADGHGREGRADEEEDDDGRLDAPMNIQGFPPRQRRRAGAVAGGGRNCPPPPFVARVLSSRAIANLRQLLRRLNPLNGASFTALCL